MDHKSKQSCPSAPLKKGHSIFARFENGVFSFNKELVQIDDSFDKSYLDDDTRSNLRVTMPCVTKGCQNWNGDKCTVPDKMRYFVEPDDEFEDYVNCPIINSCRWYAQDGEKSCRICPMIKTEFPKPKPTLFIGRI